MANEQKTLSGAFKGITLSRSETGALTVDVSPLNGVDVTVITTGGSIVKQTPAEEQTSTPGVINASVDKRAYDIGDVLPDGWVVGPCSPITGIVMAIEPVSGARLDLDPDVWFAGEYHARYLCEKGNLNARQPEHKELSAIYEDVVRAQRNSNAQLDTSAYWSGTRIGLYVAFIYFSTGRFGAVSVCDLDGRGDPVRARCVRDEPDITLVDAKGTVLYSPPKLMLAEGVLDI
jgi:hypothetical protein